MLTSVPPLLPTHLIALTLTRQHGAAVDSLDFRGRHALHMAAASGQLATMTLLVEHLRIAGGNNVAGTDQGTGGLAPLDQSAFSPLHFAAYRGNTECLTGLLTLSPYQTLAKSNAYTPLHCAIQNGHLDCLLLLLNRFGRDYLTIRDAHDRTLIHVAALANQATCLSAVVQHYQEQLLQAEATGAEDTDELSADTQPPLPRQSPQLQLASFISQSDSLGRTGLMLAASAGSDLCFSRLLDLHRQLLSDQVVRTAETSADGPRDIACHLSLAAQDSQGKTVLHHACSAPARGEQGECSTVQLVLESLTSGELASLIGLADKAGRTPLHLATIAGLPRAVELLLAAGADVYAVDSEGCIPVLSPAPSNSVATCLSLIMAAMFPPPKRLSSVFTANEALDEKKTHRKCPEWVKLGAVKTTTRRNSYPGTWPASPCLARPLADQGVHCWSGQLQPCGITTAASQSDRPGSTIAMVTHSPGSPVFSPSPSEADFY